MDVAIWLVGKSRPDVMVFPSLAMGVAYQSGIGAAANLLPKVSVTCTFNVTLHNMYLWLEQCN